MRTHLVQPSLHGGQHDLRGGQRSSGLLTDEPSAGSGRRSDRRLAADGSANGGRGWQRWLHFLPPLLLVVVAANQLVLTRSSGLSPWSGGGFGMFSTTDAGATRHLHAFVIRSGLEREVAVPAGLKDAERRALTLPSDARLTALGRQLAELPTPDHGPASAVRVQVWRTEFDPIGLTPIARIHRALQIPLQ